MNYNYHAHTFWCGHANGTPEEYVVRAIENGIKYMGFSEHIPVIYPNGKQSHFRLKVEEVDNYFKELNRLREEYKGQIDLKIGFEMEYYPKYFKQTLENAINYGAEYLILGQHFVGEEIGKYGSVSLRKNKEKKILNRYVKLVIKGIKSRVFTYIAHPDIINFEGNDEYLQKKFIKICKTAKKYNVPLEINFLGIRENRNYPNKLMLNAMKITKCPITFGFDSHNVLSAYDETSLTIAKNYVIEYNLNYIGKPNLVKLNRNIKGATN